MDHEPKDTTHSSPAIVELNTTLEQLGLLIEGVPAKVKRIVAEVSREFTWRCTVGRVLHDTKLEDANNTDKLGEAKSGDGIRAVDSGPAVREGIEGVTGNVDISRQVDAGASYDLAKEGKHRDAAVLDLDVAETFESLLVGIVEQPQWIEEAKRRLDTKFVLEGVEGSGGLAGLDGCEGGGGANDGRGDSGLHGDK